MTDINPELRLATQEDAKRISEIFHACRINMSYIVNEPLTKEDRLIYISNRIKEKFVWVVTDSGEIRGYLLLINNDLDELYRDPFWKGKGYGPFLVKKAKELSSGRLVAETCEQNIEARKFYENHEFVLDSKRGKNEEGLDTVTYIWSLQA